MSVHFGIANLVIS
jgi:hypothetical protein